MFGVSATAFAECWVPEDLHVASFREGTWRNIVQGLKEGQILRTISNMTYSESHYTSDEEKLGEVRVCRPIPLHNLSPRLGMGRPEHHLPG